MTVQEIYQQSIKHLSTADRVQLARLILNDIPDQSFVDYRECWRDDDLREFTQASWQRVEEVLGEREDAQAR